MIAGADNRGLRFGDGLFETIKFKNNQFQLLEEHFERLWIGLEKLQFDLPALFTTQRLKNDLQKIVDKNKHTHARVRLSIVRGNGGLYDPQNLQPNIIIQSWQLEQDFGSLNNNGLQLCIYREAKKICDAFSNLKHNNFLAYVMGALYAKQHQYNDAIILNQYGRIADTSIANIFLITGNTISTPALTEGCIAGTMRRFLLESFPAIGCKITEKEISEEDLLQADEIFVSNAMTPMKWVASVENKMYHNQQTMEIYRRMCKTFPHIFC